MFFILLPATNYEKNTCAITKVSENPWFVLAFGAKTTFSEVAITGRSETAESDVPCKYKPYYSPPLPP